jgi:hypothetical protein
MPNRWSEELRCPQCSQTGIVSLSQSRDCAIPTVDRAADGFKTVQSEYGPNFHCGVCDIPVMA